MDGRLTDPARPSEPAHRRCVALRGAPEETQRAADALVAALAPEDVLRVGSATEARRQLGRAFDAVVLDLHGGLDADLLGMAQGFVWGGGSLILRLPPRGALPKDARLAVFPYSVADVGARFAERFERMLPGDPALPQAPVDKRPRGTEEQARLVDALVEVLGGDAPATAAVLADRGRGKSSALGLALARLPAGVRVAVTADQQAAADQIFRFAEGRARFVPIAELLHGDERFDVLVVDEAAQLPVYLLERLATRHAAARIAFATTARGYEGTGRGFVLRFLAWARKQPRPFHYHELHAPIRFGEGDPLERFMLSLLSLDAEPAEAPARPAHDARDARDAIECSLLDRDALDEQQLREVFGLLVHAHYRTTPGDLARMLDAPNLAVHVARSSGQVIGATLVAREGGLPAELCERLAAGAERVVGHALPDTLITHSGRPEAGRLSMVRSVRIAVHPSHRLRGVARRLVDHVHRSYAPDLFGTLFGATPELLSFRRSVGYELVRVGMSRGRRSGEPAAIMVRPVSEPARALVASLRVDLARNLPLQCELLERDLALDPALARALAAGLDEQDGPSGPLEPSDEELDAAVRRYVDGPQPSDAVAFALARWLEKHRETLAILDPKTRAVVEGRVLGRRPWSELADSVTWAMRALRPAIARLLAAAR